jgi:uncharacterized protein (DUF2062 family)
MARSGTLTGTMNPRIPLIGFILLVAVGLAIILGGDTLAAPTR